jgi:hypothetical protein
MDIHDDRTQCSGATHMPVFLGAGAGAGASPSSLASAGTRCACFTHAGLSAGQSALVAQPWMHVLTVGAVKEMCLQGWGWRRGETVAPGAYSPPALRLIWCIVLATALEQAVNRSW